MLENFIGTAVGFIWNWPVSLLCLLGCIFFTIRLGLIQIRCFPHAVALVSGKYDNPNEKGQITHFQALSAALSGTIGLGNIAGVAIAIALGGPGAVFWMWIIGIFGMATKYAECALGTHYREIEKDTGIVHGGPMYYITKGFSDTFKSVKTAAFAKPMAIFYAVAISLASIGAASLFQSNQAAAALYEYYHVPKLMTGIILFCLSFFVIVGGIKRIGRVTSKIVPFMCVVYIGCATLICLLNIDAIPTAIGVILSDAFTGKATAGGLVPVFFAGVRRAIFSNEAGLGSAAIAHAAVKTDYPIREGIVASLGPLIDTIVVCSATAFVIILSGSYGTHMYKNDHNVTLSFEEARYEQQLERGWSINAATKSPVDTDPFRPHISGDKTLHYSRDARNHTPFKLRNVPNPDGMIRLAYYKKQGDMDIHVFSSTGKKIGTVSSYETDSSSDITVSHLDKSGEWYSALITVSAPDSDSLTLQFSPKGKTVDWHIDTIEPVRQLAGIALTTSAFDSFFKGFGSVFITFSVLFFAFSTIITWSYYGETASYFLFGKKAVMIFKWIFVSFIIIGATETLDVVINFSDAMIGLLVIPNMICIIALSGQVSKWTKTYFSQLKAGELKVYK